jgi:hypothetical protein
MWKSLSLKKQHDRNNTRKETMGQKEGMEREQVIAATSECEPALRDRVKDGIHRPQVWGMGKISDARALDPCLTPVCSALLHTGFPPSCCMHVSPSAVSLWQNQKNLRARIMPRGISGEEQLSAHSR